MREPRYQGAYAEAYIKSLALSAGLNAVTYDIDDGIDLQIRYTNDSDDDADELQSWPGIDLQVKSWSTPSGSVDFWSFNGLNERQYNKLVGDHVHPRYLVVLLVPPGRSSLTEIVQDGLLLRHHAFYARLTGPRIESPDRKRRCTVRVPRRNVLTAETLRHLVHPELVTPRSAP